MSASRLLFLLVMVALLFSCIGQLSPDQRVKLVQNDDLPIYFAGGGSAPTPATEKIGPVSGYSGKTSWLKSSASEEEALKNLWACAKSLNATAAVNVTCSPINFIAPQIQCWPGVYCEGDATK